MVFLQFTFALLRGKTTFHMYYLLLLLWSVCVCGGGVPHTFQSWQFAHRTTEKSLVIQNASAGLSENVSLNNTKQSMHIPQASRHLFYLISFYNMLLQEMSACLTQILLKTFKHLSVNISSAINPLKELRLQLLIQVWPLFDCTLWSGMFDHGKLVCLKPTNHICTDTHTIQTAVPVLLQWDFLQSLLVMMFRRVSDS